METDKYSIFLKISENLGEYDGSERVTLILEDEEIVLNSVDLDIRKIAVNGKPVKYRLNSEKEEIVLEGRYNGKVDIDVEFHAKIGESLMGMYQAGSSEHRMISTQFESTGARRAFPCVDNPGYKAVFAVTITIPDGYEAISNMPVEASVNEGKNIKVTFRPTPRMSTYLLYLGVAKFTKYARKFHDMEIILAGPEGTLGDPERPIKFAEESVGYYEDYFGIKYALPKMHLISVPEFGAGAMENWGAITFREVLLLVNENTSTMVMRRIGEVIAHEIAHQWFGDLVTMKWWNDLWLNESFATFMAFKVMDHEHREWDMWGDFLLSETTGAMMGDSLEQSHPIDADVTDPNSVAQIFDEISYGKGASILRMIEAYVGNENFREGLRLYLSDHALGNAEGKDLWESIEKASGMKVSEVMETWIRRMGYPYVTVVLEDSKIKLDQQRFLLSGKSTDEVWPIPMTVLDRSGNVESLILSERSKTVDAGDFAKLNSGMTGFFRTLYKGKALDHVLSNWNAFTELDKWGIISDYYAFISSGKAYLDQYIGILDRSAGDLEPLIVEEIASQLYHIWSVSASEAIRKRSVEYLKAKMEGLGDKKDGEDQRISILRGVLSNFLVRMDEEYAKARSKEFSDFRNIDPDMKGSSALAFAISGGSYSDLMNAFRGTGSDEDRGKLISAAGWMRSNSEKLKFMEDLASGVVKRQDMARFFTACADAPYSRKFLLENLERSMDMLLKAFSGSRTPSKVLEQCVSVLGLDHGDEMGKTLEKIRKPEIQTGIDKGKELLEANMSIRKLFMK